MKPFLVGIAGGTGSGKSTACYALEEKYPGKISVLHFDDYHKNTNNIPVNFGLKNWDHPKAINFSKLRADLNKLKSLKSVVIQTKDRRINPEYKYKGRVPIKIIPKEIILVEGFLCLFDSKVRKLFDLRVFLDLNHETRIKRRNKFKDAIYLNKILIPMHNKYVEPTKRYADIIIDVGKLSQNQVLKRLEKILRQRR